MKNYIKLIAITIITGLLLFTGCPDPFNLDFKSGKPDKYDVYIPEGQGTVIVYIGDPTSARTLGPDISSIVKFKIEFTPPPESTGTYVYTEITAAGRDGSLVFANPGVYNVTVTGYLADDTPVVSGFSNVNVISGVASPVRIIMNQSAGTDPGTFDYSALEVPVDYLKEKNGTAVLELINTNTGVTAVSIDLLYDFNDPKTVSVPPGAYFMEITLRNGSQLVGEEIGYLVGARVQEIVYIFSDMTTVLPAVSEEYGVSYKFTKDDFLAELSFSGTLNITGSTDLTFSPKEIQISWNKNDLSPVSIALRPGDMKITGNNWSALVDISKMLENTTHSKGTVDTSEPLYFRVLAQDTTGTWSICSKWTEVYIGGGVSGTSAYHTTGIAISGAIYSLAVTDATVAAFSGQVAGQVLNGDERTIYFFDGTNMDIAANITIPDDRIFVPSPDMLLSLGFTRDAIDKYTYKAGNTVLIAAAGSNSYIAGGTNKISVTSGKILSKLDLVLPEFDTGAGGLDITSVDITWTDGKGASNKITVPSTSIAQSGGTWTVTVNPSDLKGVVSGTGDFLTGDTVFNVSAQIAMQLDDDTTQTITATLGDFPIADIIAGTSSGSGGSVKIVEISSSLSPTLGTVTINGQETYYAVGGNRVSITVLIKPADGLAFVATGDLADMGLAGFTRKDAKDGTPGYTYTGSMFTEDRDIVPHEFVDKASFSGTWSRSVNSGFEYDKAIEVSYTAAFTSPLTGPSVFTYTDNDTTALDGTWTVDIGAREVSDLSRTMYFRIKFTFENGQTIYSPVVSVSPEYIVAGGEVDISVTTPITYGPIYAIMADVVEGAGKVTFNDYDNFYYAFENTSGQLVIKMIPADNYEYVSFGTPELPGAPYSLDNLQGYRTTTDAAGRTTYTYSNFAFNSNVTITPKYFINAFSFSGTWNITNLTSATIPDINTIAIESSWTSSTANSITTGTTQLYSDKTWVAEITVANLIKSMPLGTTLNNNRGLYFRLRMTIDSITVYTPWTLTAFGGENSSIDDSHTKYETTGISWDFELYRITATVTGGTGSVSLNGRQSGTTANSFVREYLFQSVDGNDTNTVTMQMIPGATNQKYEPGYSILNDMFVYHGLDGSGYESYTFTGRMKIPVTDENGEITGYTYRGYQNAPNVEILVFFNGKYATNLGQWGTKLDSTAKTTVNANGTTTYTFTEFYPVSQMTKGNGLWSGEENSNYCWAWVSNLAKDKWLSNYSGAYAGGSSNPNGWTVGTRDQYKAVRNQIGSNVPYYNTGNGRDRFWTKEETGFLDANAYYIRMDTGGTGDIVKSSWCRIWPLRSATITIRTTPNNP